MMLRVALVDSTGTRTGEVDLPEAIFGIDPNEPVVHQALLSQLAGRRLGTHATKTRGQVRGGGRKAGRQMGTGGARAGWRRAPLWVGGGITFGPLPRNHAHALPKRMRRLAIRSLLADRARSGRVIVLDDLRPEVPKTRELAAVLERLGVGREKVLLVTPIRNAIIVKAAGNLPGVTVLTARTLNVHDLLTHPTLLVTREALSVLQDAWAEPVKEVSAEPVKEVSADPVKEVSADPVKEVRG